MKLKPTYEKTYQIRFSRGSDVQTTEVVDATAEEVRVLICKCMRGHFAHPKSKVAATKIVVLELDHVRKKSSISKFVYTNNGKDFEKDFVLVFNLSPRQVRLEIEKAIRKTPKQ
jgi:hypothetical protein